MHVLKKCLAMISVVFANANCATALQVKEICLQDCGDDIEESSFFVGDDPLLVQRKEAFEQTAKSTNYSPEVYLGIKAQLGEFDAVVGLSQERAGGKIHCTGNLISDRLVVTARHCCEKGNCGARYAHFGTDIRTAIETIAVEKEIRFPAGSYRRIPDIVLLKLKQKPVSAKPISIAPQDWIDNSIAFRIAGFGQTEYYTSGIKKIGDAYIASNNCNRPPQDGFNDEDLYSCVPKLEMVGEARTDYPADTCKGDSGGGAFVVPPDAARSYERYDSAFKNNNHALGAITSRVIKRSASYLRQTQNEQAAECGVGGVYLRLDGPIYKWIKSVAAEQGEKLPR